MARPKGSRNRPRVAPPIVSHETPPLPTEVVGRVIEKALSEPAFDERREASQAYESEGRKWPQESAEDKFTQGIDQPTPIRKLWELAHNLGAPVKNRFDRHEIEASLARVGYEATEPEPEDVSDYWAFRSRTVGSGPISAYDPNGEFSADYYPDGRCTITHHVAPNLLSRIPGMRYHDEIFEITNLEEFAARLVLLVNEGDVIFDESVEAHNQGVIEETARINRESDHGPESIHGADWKIGQMRELCPQFGFVDSHEPNVQRLPVKLAEALGVSLTYEEGAYEGQEKDWQVLAKDVLAKAEELDVVNVEISGPVFGRNAEEPVMR